MPADVSSPNSRFLLRTYPKQPLRQTYIVVPSLPSNNIERAEELQALRSAVLRDGSPRRIALTAVKDQAERARQDCQAQQHNVRAFLGILKATNCVLGETNYTQAQQEVRQLQVEISSKQREVQRLDRQNLPY